MQIDRREKINVAHFPVKSFVATNGERNKTNVISEVYFQHPSALHCLNCDCIAEGQIQ